MNDQIKYLAIKAGLDIDGFGYPIWGCLDGEDAKKEFLEKFAELIVRKCIHKIENESEQYAAPVWAVELMDDIKETFGVKE